jgi:hypothetical protein
MDKLEHYLDRVCRTIGGPRSMRLHVRQEIREHLLDAAAQHCAAGMTMGDALERAIADFGGPEQVRAELEATHGHRFLAVVIDRAMQWRENTMRAKWLWGTCAHLAVFAVVAINIFFFAFVEMMFVPKLKKLQNDGWLTGDAMALPVLDWLNASLRMLAWLGDHATWLMLAGLGLWGLFEWRVRSENKPAMRLTLFGTLAVLFTIGSAVIASAMIIPFLIGTPDLARNSIPAAIEQLTIIDASIHQLDEALKSKDWPSMNAPADQAMNAVSMLGRVLDANAGRTPPRDKVTLDELRRQIHIAQVAVAEILDAIAGQDADKLAAAIKKLREIGATWK